ncbi:Glycerate kinase [Entamoeba marina]
MKVVVACDSFKGSISSSELNQCIARTINKYYPSIHVQQFVIGDGGEGTLDCLLNNFNSTKIQCIAHDPLMNKIEVEYGIINNETAVIEMASISGLPLVPPDQRNPMKTTTYGTGELIRDALERGIRKFIIGVGGSATNDGGCGMMQALNCKFYDENQIVLGQGGEILTKIKSIDNTNLVNGLKESQFTIACDVRNPLCGEHGAAYVYAKQKGATKEMIQELDDGLSSFAKVIKKMFNIEIENVEGSGAAGGLAGGFLAFTNASLQSGIDLVLDTIQFEKAIEDADYIITGEGKVDQQSFMGKVLDGIFSRAKKFNVQMIVIAGCLDFNKDFIPDELISTFCIQSGPTTLEEAMQPKEVNKNVELLIRNIFRLINKR